MTLTDGLNTVCDTLGKGIADTFKTPLTPKSICRYYKSLQDVSLAARHKVSCDTFQTHIQLNRIANHTAFSV